MSPLPESLPMPLRVAAGLVAVAVEQARELPRKVLELPVTTVSKAAQVSMRLQQKVTELAIKGDQVIGTLRPAPENPSWARFDEDEVSGPTPAAMNGLPGDGRPDAVALAGATSPRAEPATVSPLPGYDDMTIAQLRARLRRLSLATLRDVLVWETAHQNRPPFVTMLTNRIATVTAE